MKPYGLRPGDGDKRSNKFKNYRDTRPKGRRKEHKLHEGRRLVHRQGRQDGKAQIRAEMEA
jgi:hypothetical protein